MYFICFVQIHLNTEIILLKQQKFGYFISFAELMTYNLEAIGEIIIENYMKNH